MVEYKTVGEILSMGIEIRKIRLRGKDYEYTLERKSVKNINLRIKPGEIIYVSANKRVNINVIEGFIKSKEDFILSAFKNFERIELITENNSEIDYNTGDEISYFGKKLSLKVVESNKESVKASGEKIYIFVKDIDDRNKKENLLKKWELSLAKEVFTKMVELRYPEFKSMGVVYPDISIRRMTSRWGSCKPNGSKITLNLELLHKPKECLEYVVVHELAHFIHPNHSKEFWNLVASKMPDYKMRREILNGRLTQ